MIPEYLRLYQKEIIAHDFANDTTKAFQHRSNCDIPGNMYLGTLRLLYARITLADRDT